MEEDIFLIELNMKEFERDVLDTLYELKLQGIIPIIAHPERYYLHSKTS